MNHSQFSKCLFKKTVELSGKGVIDLYSSFRFTAKLMRVQRFPIYPCPTYHRPEHSGAFVITGEPALTHHYHPEAVVYIRVTLKCGTF